MSWRYLSREFLSLNHLSTHARSTQICAHLLETHFVVQRLSQGERAQRITQVSKEFLQYAPSVYDLQLIHSQVTQNCLARPLVLQSDKKPRPVL